MAWHAMEATIKYTKIQSNTIIRLIPSLSMFVGIIICMFFNSHVTIRFEKVKKEWVCRSPVIIISPVLSNRKWRFREKSGRSSRFETFEVHDRVKYIFVRVSVSPRWHFPCLILTDTTFQTAAMNHYMIARKEGRKEGSKILVHPPWHSSNGKCFLPCQYGSNTSSLFSQTDISLPP